MRLALLPVIASLLLLTACKNDPIPSSHAATSGSANAAKPAGLRDRDPALAHRLVAEGAILLDVRTPEEFSGRHLNGAVNIPVEDLEGKLAEVEKLTGGDKKKPIVVYCATGARSKYAKKALVKAGYEQVSNLGAISAW